MAKSSARLCCGSRRESTRVGDLARFGHLRRSARAIAHHPWRARRIRRTSGCPPATSACGQRWGWRGDGRHDALTAHRHVLHARTHRRFERLARSSMRIDRSTGRDRPADETLDPDGKLARRGQHIAREYSVDLFQLQRVGEVMDRDFVLLPATTPLADDRRLASGDPTVCRHQGTLLGNEAGELAGIITRGDVVRALEQAKERKPTVAEAGQAHLIVTYPSARTSPCHCQASSTPGRRLPVVDRAAPKRVVGYLGRAGLGLRGSDTIARRM